MAEIGSATSLPSTPVSSRRQSTAQDSIEEQQALADLQRLVEEQKKQDRNQRDIGRAEDRRALLDNLRADESREIQRQRDIRDQFRDRQLVNREQAVAANDGVERQQRLDRKEADVRALADSRDNRAAADRAVVDIQRRQVETENEQRRLERRIADAALERRQGIDLDQSQRRLSTTGFDPSLPRGSIVNVTG